MQQAFTANRLTDGRVVYLTAAGGWTEDFDQSFLCTNEHEISEYQRRAELAAVADEVVEPYAIDVERGPRGARPVRYREVIRAFGPSTDLTPTDFTPTTSAGAS